MLISLTTLLTNLSAIFHSRAALQLENLALRHQIGALQRSVRNRPKLTLVDATTKALPGANVIPTGETRGAHVHGKRGEFTRRIPAGESVLEDFNAIVPKIVQKSVSAEAA
jgi:hypothetical protein